MVQTKLISVRVPEDVLEEIDKAAAALSYHKRSDVINAALRLMVECSKKGLCHKVVRFSPESGDVVDELSFKYH